MNGRTETKGNATGRQQFSRYSKLLSILSIIFSLLPPAIRYLIWDISNPFGGKLAIALRYALLRASCKTIGSNVYVGQNVRIVNPARLSLGNNISIHANCYIDAVGSCSIGENVSIAHASSIITFDHTWGDKDTPIKYNPTKLAAVKIENDCWVGCGVRILSGVSIGTRSVVAAGAVVQSDIPECSIAAGVPARVVKPTAGVMDK